MQIYEYIKADLDSGWCQLRTFIYPSFTAQFKDFRTHRFTRMLMIVSDYLMVSPPPPPHYDVLIN